MKNTNRVGMDLSMVDCFQKTETQSMQLRRSKSDFDALIDQLRSSAFVKQMSELRGSIIN
ncbi:hypothetical protein [Algihabitans albus]|uniref:hypothetical protein n=1 Tax=Algihabitans albus TaxID=2164067 RepID=UPI000E5C57B6|nr:hypothetical protein [Algihabitans albus]